MASGYSEEKKDGVTVQDRLMAQMSPAQIRLYRQNAQRQATQANSHSQSHSNAQKALQEAIHTGERLTNASLKRLVAQAKSSAGLDAGEILDFTLGNTRKNKKISQNSGLKNSLSPAILQFYIENVKQSAKHFAGGISPRQVVNQSRAIDIKRANEQIFLATTFKRQGNAIYWLTNAGAGSKSQNHKVVTELLDYPNLMIGRTAIPPRQEIKNLLENGKIKFDCDCGRHQYWYRYIATTGKFNFGAHENRYPSTRNPQLTGVACKHVLRVMHSLMGEYGIQKARGYIKQDLADGKGKGLSQRQTAKQIREEAQRQSGHRSAEHWRKKIKQQLKLAVKSLTPMATQQQYQVMWQMQKVGLQFSPEQKAQFEAYQRNQAPYIRGK